ncbi:unnamed protein product [Pedinophyceae sp. YPF-701]|nr:unnamed protein product [Pedinophyceae sp. YPF-701]
MDEVQYRRAADALKRQAHGDCILAGFEEFWDPPRRAANGAACGPDAGGVLLEAALDIQHVCNVTKAKQAPKLLKKSTKAVPSDKIVLSPSAEAVRECVRASFQDASPPLSLQDLCRDETLRSLILDNHGPRGHHPPWWPPQPDLLLKVLLETLRGSDGVPMFMRPLLEAKAQLNRQPSEAEKMKHMKALWLALRNDPAHTSASVSQRDREENADLLARLEADIRAWSVTDRCTAPRAELCHTIQGKEHEAILNAHLRALGVPFQSERESRERNEPCTPDALLLVPIMITAPGAGAGSDRLVHWIDSKAMFGDKTAYKDNAAQFKKYAAVFGPGLVVWWSGFARDAQAEAPGDMLFMDRFPRPEEVQTLRAGPEGPVAATLT